MMSKILINMWPLCSTYICDLIILIYALTGAVSMISKSQFNDIENLSLLCGCLEDLEII